MTIRTLKNLLYGANFLGVLAALVLIVGAISSATVVQPVYKPISAGTAELRDLPSGRQRPAADYRSCIVTGVVEPEKNTFSGADGDMLPPIKGRYKLYSTFFVRSPDGEKRGFAAIAYENNEGMYTENERVGEYMLAQIFPDNVILEKGGKSFTLEREASAGKSAPAAPSRSAKPSRSRPKRTRTRSRSSPQHKGLKDQPDRSLKGEELRSSQNFSVSSKDKNYITDNFAQVLHDVNLKTELSQDGSMTGVTIGRIKTGSILYTKGNLRAGDIIRSINGTPVNSVRQVMTLYEDLTKQDVKRVTVDIERDGQLITQNYSITD